MFLFDSMNIIIQFIYSFNVVQILNKMEKNMHKNPANKRNSKQNQE